MTSSLLDRPQTPVMIINARLLGYRGLQQLAVNASGDVTTIRAMGKTKRAPKTEGVVWDLNGDLLTPGGVDLQINGALGLAFPDLTQEDLPKLQKIQRLLWEQGVDGFVPTLVTTSMENIGRSLACFAQAMEVSSNQPQAEILGVHLEGPFLNPQKRGAHPEEFLLPLTLDNLKKALGDWINVVKIVTLAPELDPSGEVVKFLRSQGIIVSLGHSQATAEQAQQAFQQGATMVTHAFNAMPSLHHREPGLLGAALVHPDVQCGLIADGQHVSPIMMQILLSAAGYQSGIFLVSDALAPLGLPDGVYPWDRREIEVKNGTARLPDGTLSGTTLPLLVGVQNLVKWGICEGETAIALATTAPRQALQAASRSKKPKKLELYLHQPLHRFLRWHQDEKTAELTWERLLKTA